MAKHNGHNQGQPWPQGVPILGTPVIGATKWICAKGHTFTGDPPKMALPLNPLQPLSSSSQIIGADRICLFCVLEFWHQMFPVRKMGDPIVADVAETPPDVTEAP